MQESVDYNCYRLTFLENVKCLLVVFFLSGAAAWLLYKSLWGMLLWIVIYPVYRRYFVHTCIIKRKQELLLQFKDAMQSISAALLSGYSIENAWKEAEKELGELYGTEAYMTVELRQMNHAIQTSRPVEELLCQFAERSGCEDITAFAEVFRFAKRNGGNFSAIIQNTVYHITEKREVEQEIETVIAGKKLEQKIMNVVPAALLGYLNLTSEEFLAPLYGNGFGICVMTTAFLAYLAALLLAYKIVDIKV